MILLSVLRLKTLNEPSSYPHAAIVSSYPNLVTMSSFFYTSAAFTNSLFFKGTFYKTLYFLQYFTLLYDVSVFALFLKSCLQFILPLRK